MTVIAYRKGILAADSLITIGSRRHSSMLKMARGPDGSIAGVSGDVGSCRRFLDWIVSGEVKKLKPPDDDDDYDAILVRPDGRIFDMCDKGYLLEVKVPYFAIGSGCQYAIGAMHAGATAVEACRAAIKHDVTCGGPVIEERLK